MQIDAVIQATLDSLVSHVCIVDHLGTIVATNDAWSRFATENGARPEGVGIGVNYFSVCRMTDAAEGHEAEQFVRGLADVLEGKANRLLFEYPCHGPNEKRWFTVRVVRCAGEGPVRAVIAHENVSRERQIERAFVEAKNAAEQANRAKSDFLANMSHELRTPLNGLIGMADLLMATNLTDQQRQFVDIARSSGATLLATIGDILDFSKIEAGRMELEEIDYDLHELLESAADLVAARAAEKGIELSTDLATSLPDSVHGDPTRLKQVILNLLSNAVKFSERGGEVSMEASVSQRHGVRELKVVVTDTGVGMTPTQLAAMFRPFVQAERSTTRRFGGTGLGLSISRQLVQLMGGEIRVESAPGVGSRFAVVIPLTAPVGLEAARKREALAGVRALVIEGHPRHRAVLQRLLTDAGCKVMVAATAEEGERCWLASVGGETRPQVVVMAQRLPDSSGEALARRIEAEARGEKVPMVLLTSLAELRVLNERSPFTRALAKPIKRDALVRVVSEAVGRRSPSATLLRHESLRGKRVLLVDDNAINRLVAVALLERVGVIVTVATNGRDALLRLASDPVDLILMDCQMAELDVYEATSAIRNGAVGAALSTVTIIALTAQSFADDRRRCVEAGMTDYLTKPIDLAQLEAIVERHQRH